MSSSPMFGEDITPRPFELIESIRDFGYSLPTAIADLVDNCITAGATSIEISIASDSNDQAHIAVVDDGNGMSIETLVEALRLGSGAPPAIRKSTDLGRFGFGLKTASLSLGRSLTVITKRPQDSVPSLRTLDMDYIRQMDSWVLSTAPSDSAAQYLTVVGNKTSGTAVVISNLDRTSFLNVSRSKLHEHLGVALRSLETHLRMVFHQFIESGLRIRIGSTTLSAWDPFVKARSTPLAPETIHFKGQGIQIAPFVLPHHSKLSDTEHGIAGGPHGWNAHQGFYIYRSGRLIVPGTWLNLPLKKEEHYKLARIVVELPNTMDAEWHLNVMKAHVAAPASLRDDLRRIATRTRTQAAEVYRYRGERVAPTNAPPQRFVWKRVHAGRGVAFTIDRSHPSVQALLHGGCEHEAALDALLSIVERTVPVAAMLQDPPKSLDGAATPEVIEGLNAYVELARHTELFFLRAGKSVAEARRLVLNAEPFAQWRDVIANPLDSPSE